MKLRAAFLIAWLLGCSESHDLGLDASTRDDVGLDGNPHRDADGRASDVQFCTDEHVYECARDLAAGRITMSAYNTCQMRVDAECSTFTWPAGCDPSTTLRSACIAAVSDASRLATTNDMIEECSLTTLCAP